MNYLYSKIEYDANFECNTPERKAFAEHLQLVIKALHDIEWVDSGDYGKGDENEAIRACVGDISILEVTIENANKALERLSIEIERANSINMVNLDENNNK